MIFLVVSLRCVAPNTSEQRSRSGLCEGVIRREATETEGLVFILNPKTVFLLASPTKHYDSNKVTCTNVYSTWDVFTQGITKDIPVHFSNLNNVLFFHRYTDQFIFGHTILIYPSFCKKCLILLKIRALWKAQLMFSCKYLY